MDRLETVLHVHVAKRPNPRVIGKPPTFSPNVGQTDSALADELQALVDVFDLLDAHSGDFVVSAETGISDDLLLNHVLDPRAMASVPDKIF